MDYSKRFENLQTRKNGDITKIFSMENFSESVTKSDLQKSKLLRYVIGAMEPVDEEYTKNTIKEGDRVRLHLEKDLNQVKFAYQGSVTNNTHISRYSDIDLLTICDKFFTYPKNIPELDGYGGGSYTGNPENDLKELRNDCISILTKSFTSVEIDTSGAKLIGLSGGSLRRKVDVVPANYYHTEEYKKTKLDYLMGIQVYDSKNHKRVLNTPFYHNELLNQKDQKTNGNFKRVVRLLKTLKVDSEKNIELSSYDLTAIAYHMDDILLNISNKPILLIIAVENFLEKILLDYYNLKALEVPDKSRKIIKRDKDIYDLNFLKAEISEIRMDLENELSIQKVLPENIIYSYT